MNTRIISSDKKHRAAITEEDGYYRLRVWTLNDGWKVFDTDFPTKEEALNELWRTFDGFTEVTE